MVDTKVGKHKAENVTVEDSGSYFSGSDVEAVLQEIKLTIVDGGATWDFSVGASILFKIRKSDKQLLLSASLDTDGGF